MSVNEDLGSSYQTIAANNTPDGLSNIGTDLDNHIRDIKRNIRILADCSRGTNPPTNIRGRLWFDSSATDSSTFALKIGNGGTKWGTFATVNYDTGVVFCPANPNDFVSTGSTIAVSYPLSATGSLISGINIYLPRTAVSATVSGTTFIPSGVDPYGRVMDTTAVSALAASPEQVASGSGVSRFLTPFSQGYGSPAAKGWIAFDGSGTVSATTSFLTFNVDNAYRSAAGVYVVSWTNTFSTNRYPAIAIVGNMGVGGNTLVVGSSTTTTTFFKFKLVTAAAGAAQDCNRINVVAYGVWA